MLILAFHYWSGAHDASAAVVRDGRLVAAAEEERFSRRKHDGGLPLRAIEYCLREAGASMADVDVLAFPTKPYRSGSDSGLAEVDYATLRLLQQDGTVRRRSLVHKRLMDALLRLGVRYNWQMNDVVRSGITGVRDHFGPLPPIRFYGHHESHAAVAFLTSGVDEAAVVTVDGRGAHFSAVSWLGSGDRLRQLRAEPYTNSLGNYYKDCTRYLGFGEFGEGKAMGLAAYGAPERYTKVAETLLVTTSARWYEYRTPPSPAVVGFPARTSEPVLESAYTDFAAAVQQALETALERIAQDALAGARQRTLCLGGGVVLNCSANGKLARRRVGESRWVFPAAGDAGLSVGAALLCAAELGELTRARLRDAYLGPAFTASDCEAAIEQEARVQAYRSAQIEAEAARLIADGNVVGWFQGRMEFGPRALGNRSILADPRTVQMRDRVNRIKRRELWRPLAPVVPLEVANEFFELSEPSPFMLFAACVKESVRVRIPAVVHVDGTARPQTVTEAVNPRLHGLLRRFEDLTGVPVLLNTSFNDAGEPIVCTPADALRTFLRTGLDVLVLGDYVVQRREQLLDAAAQKPHASSWNV